MKIGLIDVDSHNFPNLAQMKISSYFKSIGADVERWNGLRKYDAVYMSKVFDETYTKDEEHCIMADLVVRGGTGYNLCAKLPDAVEHAYPDYDLYGTDKAYGFLTRGCPRHCPWCIVSEKEGRKTEQVAELDEFYRGQREIVLMDSNINAAGNAEDLFEQLADASQKNKTWINFGGGLDVRLMTDKECDAVNRMKIKVLHFAWDDPSDEKAHESLRRVRPLLNIRDNELVVYVLCNYNSTIEQDLERIYELRGMGYTPYVMIYDKPHAPRKLRQIQRWCNNRFIFRACDRFEEYEGASK